MTQPEMFKRLTEEYHKYRATVKAGLRTLDPDALRDLAAALIVAGKNPEIIAPHNMERVFGLAHIGVMGILLELENETEQVSKAV